MPNQPRPTDTTRTRERVSNAVATTAAGGAPAAPAQVTVVDLIERQKPQIARALSGITTADPERFTRIVTTQIRKTKSLQQANATSLLGAVMALAQVGLEPDGRNAHLVAFGGQVTPIIDYRGYMELARRSGQVADIYAHEVYEGDDFWYRYGLNRDLHHVPGPASRRGPLTHAYCVIHFTNGGYHFVVLQREDVEARRARSASVRSGRQSPWDTDEAAMWRKSSVRAIASYMPYSPQLVAATEVDRRIDQGQRTFNADEVLDVESYEEPPPDEPAPPADQETGPADG